MEPVDHACPPSSLQTLTGWRRHQSIGRGGWRNICRERLWAWLLGSRPGRLAHQQAWRVDTGHAPRWGSDGPLVLASLGGGHPAALLEHWCFPAFLYAPLSTWRVWQEALGKRGWALPSQSCRESRGAEHTVCSASLCPSCGGPRVAGAMRSVCLWGLVSESAPAPSSPAWWVPARGTVAPLSLVPFLTESVLRRGRGCDFTGSCWDSRGMLGSHHDTVVAQFPVHAMRGWRLTKAGLSCWRCWVGGWAGFPPRKILGSYLTAPLRHLLLEKSLGHS